MSLSRLVPLLAIFGLCGTAGCTALEARAPATSDRHGPGVRNAHTIFYDVSRREIVLFGGADEQAVRHDTWTWNGSTWRFLTNRGPSRRTFPASAYDIDGKVAYLFGGNRVLFGTAADANTFLADLWKWDGKAWQLQHSDGPAPDARAEAAMAFDQRRRQLVLFGGRRVADGRTLRLGDTWEWDGRAWTLKEGVGGPTPRSGITMGYDPGRGVTVLFGGSTGTTTGETWEWDGVRWAKSAAQAEPRFNAVMTYDPGRRRMLRFGGWLHPRRYGDTWIYEGTRWHLLHATGPAPRNHAALAYDQRRARIVLIGGHDGARVFGDVWEWVGDHWVQAGGVAPKARIENGH